MTWYRIGYIAGLHADVVRQKFPTNKAYRMYNKGYAKGLGTLYFRILMKSTEGE